MTEEKELVFINPNEVPRLLRKTGRDWSKLFKQIPKNQVLVLDTEIYGSSTNIRNQVINYNKSNKNEKLKMNQRTDRETQKTTVYIQRVE